MKKYFYLLIGLCFLFSCAAKKKAVFIAGNYSGGDGSSFEQAVIINETSESRGVEDENAWLAKNYRYARSDGQAMEYDQKKPYDILTITTRDDKTIQVYFDISKFYGKF